MTIRELTLTDIRCYSGVNAVTFSPAINLLVGANNSGKSTLLHALKLLQSETGSVAAPRLRQMLRQSCDSGSITYAFDNPSIAFKNRFKTTLSQTPGTIKLRFEKQGPVVIDCMDNRPNSGVEAPSVLGDVLPADGDNAFFYYLSLRKPAMYQGAVGRVHEVTVRETNPFLAAKIDRYAVHGNPKADTYQRKLKRVLGFGVSTSGGPYDNTKVGGVFSGDGEHFVELEDMGAGVGQVAALVADLVTARNKIFLIEEPENDLHPQSLIRLLAEIREASQFNQFIISTHSNIVVSRLGVAGARIFYAEQDRSVNIPITRLAEIGDGFDERSALLERLGYGIADVGLFWSAYLLLEESTAERVLRGFLIPAFAPSLRHRLRTFACGGTSTVERRFEAMHSLFVFLHTSSVYTETAWVRLDAGPNEDEVVAKLRCLYKKTPSDRFGTWRSPRFEDYYPSDFEGEVAALAALDGPRLLDAKGKIAVRVVEWANSDIDRGRAHFSTVAPEVISLLREIERTLDALGQSASTSLDC